MKTKTPHLDNLEKCKCQNIEYIDNSNITSINTHYGKSSNQIMASTIKRNKYKTQYIDIFRSTLTTIPPRNKF